jgi:hypothetical protein
MSLKADSFSQNLEYYSQLIGFDILGELEWMLRFCHL